jgi:hypothetical protein
LCETVAAEDVAACGDRYGRFRESGGLMGIVGCGGGQRFETDCADGRALVAGCDGADRGVAGARCAGVRGACHGGRGTYAATEA